MTARDVATRAGAMAWIAWGTAVAFFFYAWVLRVSPSVLVGELRAELHVGSAIVGHLSALYFYAYAGMQVPVGMVLDRLGARWPLALSMLICAGGTCVFALSTGLAGLSIGRFLIGFGAAFSLVGAIHVANHSLPPERFALLSGLSMMAGMIGGVVGQAPVRLLVDEFGWRPTLLVLAAAGLVLAVVTVTVVRDGNTPRQVAGGRDSSWQGLKGVLRERQNWLCALAGLGATGPLLGFGALWGVPFLEQAYDLPTAEAAGIASLLLLGWGVGSPTFGWLSDRLSSRRGPLLGGIGLAMTALAILVHVPLPSVGFAAALAFLTGFGGSAQIVGFAFARAHNPPGRHATAYGFINGTAVGAGALFQPLIGALVDAAATTPGTLDGAAYRVGLSALLVGLAVSMLAATALREPARAATGNPQ